MAGSVWVKTAKGDVIRSDRINRLTFDKVDRAGWAVIAVLGRGEWAVLATLGRGGAARRGAERLCHELPEAVAAARQKGTGVTVSFIKAGYPKGGGQWSTLAGPAADVRPIPVVPPPGQARQRRQGMG